MKEGAGPTGFVTIQGESGVGDYYMVTAGKPKTVLVTGAAGFLGHAVAETLRRSGHGVISLDVRTGRDVLDKAAVETAVYGVGAVIYLAGPSSSLMYREEPARRWREAVRGLRNIMESFKGRIVFASTGTVYGDSITPAEEGRDLPPPPNLYAAAKLECERLCLLYNLKGGDAKIVRIFTGYGPGELTKGIYASPVWRFIEDIVRGVRPAVYGDGLQVRDFVFVHDIVTGLMRALQTDSREHVFNVGTGRGTRLLDLVHLISRQVGRSVDPILVEPPKGYVASVVADVSLARRELGFSAGVAIEDGIRLTFRELAADSRYEA